jgi:hypothetical protein
MNSSNEFDELARQKLAERSFPFEEGHWQAAQEVLHAQRGGSTRGFWIVGAIALLLASGGAWWWMEDGVVVEQNTVAAIEIEQDKSAIALEDNDAALQQIIATTPDAQEAGARSISEVRATTSVGKVESEQPERTTGQVPTRAQNARTVSEGSSTGTRATGTSGAATPSTEQEVLRSLDAVTTLTELRDAEQTAEATSIELVATGSSTLPIQERSSSTAEEMPIGPVGTPEEATDQNIAVVVDATHVDTPTEVIATQRDPVSTVVANSDAESANVGTTEQPQDSADVAVPEPLQLPLVAQNSPWEIGALAGIFSTTSSFRGANSADWNSDVARQRTNSFGAEIMRMGSNFGVGLGMQYGSYAERIAVGEVNNTVTEVDRFWFLSPEQQSVLVITDTIVQDGEPYFVGETVTTTIDVLTQGFDTTTTITQQRAARELYNRVNYLEIPLLLDAHLVQGRWSIGLRGGPTLGVLTGRSGYLPNNSNDGYTDFSEQAFREMVLGYTARAYIRYRWNAAWSIGLEPAIRGQLMNSLAEGPLERRSSAFGGMLSLSYRLR